MDQQPKRLYRSTTNRMVAGVCGGLAEYFQVDPTLIRAAFVIMLFGGGFGLLAYLVLWVIIPEAGTAQRPLGEQAQAAGQQMKDQAQTLAEKVRTTDGNSGRVIMGAAFVLIGGLALAKMFFPWRILEWHYLWPLLLVAIGLMIIMRKK